MTKSVIDKKIDRPPIEETIIGLLYIAKLHGERLLESSDVLERTADKRYKESADSEHDNPGQGIPKILKNQLNVARHEKTKSITVMLCLKRMEEYASGKTTLDDIVRRIED